MPDTIRHWRRGLAQELGSANHALRQLHRAAHACPHLHALIGEVAAHARAAADHHARLLATPEVHYV